MVLRIKNKTVPASCDQMFHWSTEGPLVWWRAGLGPSQDESLFFSLLHTLPTSPLVACLRLCGRTSMDSEGYPSPLHTRAVHSDCLLHDYGVRSVGPIATRTVLLFFLGQSATCMDYGVQHEVPRRRYGWKRRLVSTILGQHGTKLHLDMSTTMMDPGKPSHYEYDIVRSTCLCNMFQMPALLPRYIILA